MQRSSSDGGSLNIVCACTKFQRLIAKCERVKEKEFQIFHDSHEQKKKYRPDAMRAVVVLVSFFFCFSLFSFAAAHNHIKYFMLDRNGCALHR